VHLGALVVGVQIGLDVRHIRSVELHEAVAEQMHCAHKARHLTRQEGYEPIERTLVEALRELHPGIRPEGASNESHVDAVETAAVPKQHIVDLSACAQFFERFH